MADLSAAFKTASAGQRDLATRPQLTAAGLPRNLLSVAVGDGDLFRIHRSVYGLRPLEPRPEHLVTADGPAPTYLRRVQAALLAGGDGVVACARTAAVVWGLDMLVEPDAVELAVRRDRIRLNISGARVSRCAKPPESVDVGGLDVTPALTTLEACARTRPVMEAVVLIDSLLRRRLVRLDTVVAAAGRGSRLQRAVLLADPRSESVLESALRVLLIEAGLPPPESQYVIRGDGRFVARVDFCWPALRLIVEADGRRWHDPDDRRNADRRRANGCASYGWRILRFTWADVLHEPEYVIACVRQAVHGDSQEPQTITG
jgi:hypothetical protein